MTTKLWDIVNEKRARGIPISDEEAKEVCELCYRKMEMTKIQNQEEYLPLLFEDELYNYLFGLVVNAKTMLRTIEREAINNV